MARAARGRRHIADESLADEFHDTLLMTRACPTGSERQLGFMGPPARAPGAEGRVPVRVVEGECVDVTLALLAEFPGERVCLLNMASERVPGGGVYLGCRTQEEEICRKTSLFRTLRRTDYPLPDDALIYSPTVHIVKTGPARRLLARPSRPISVVTMAAKRWPALRDGDYADPADRALMLRKIQTVLETARARGQTVLVLGAWGCGAFAHPPAQVARLFAHALQRYPGDAFRLVVFAVMVGSARDRPNLDAFRHFFG